MSEFKGVSYPIVKDTHGHFRTQDAIGQIKSDLLILLLTNPGERVMLPEFGTPLRDLLFDPNDLTLAARAQDVIAQAISQWEPRVAIDQIEVSISPDASDLSPQDDFTQSQHVLLIRINFKEFTNIQEVQELELAIPLEGVR